jgi:hypothetical protein
MSFEKMQNLFAKHLNTSKEQLESSGNKVANCLMYQNDGECRKKVGKFNQSLRNYDEIYKVYLTVLDRVLYADQKQFNSELRKSHAHPEFPLELGDKVNLSPALTKVKEDYCRNTDQYLTTKKGAEEFKKQMLSELHRKCIQANSSHWNNCETLNETVKELNKSIKEIEENQAQNKKVQYISYYESLLFSPKGDYFRDMEEKLNEKSQYSPF